MDPAKEEPLRSAMDMQGVMLGRHEEELSAARLAVEGLTAQVTDLSSRLLMLYQDPSADPRRYPLHEPRINNPPCYAGEPTECRAFLTQCEVVFSLQPQTYAGDPARIAFVLSLLTGRAREWGTSAWEARTSCCGRYELFKEEMIKIFDRSVFGREASRLLTTLHQGRRSVADFAIEFRTLATTCEWNEPALVARFLEGLNMDLKEEIYARGPPAQLDQLIELGIRLDRCFEQRRRIRGPVSRPLETLTPAVVSSPLCSDPEPMQRGGVHISAEERERRIRSRLSSPGPRRWERRILTTRPPGNATFDALLPRVRCVPRLSLVIHHRQVFLGPSPFHHGRGLTLRWILLPVFRFRQVIRLSSPWWIVFLKLPILSLFLSYRPPVRPRKSW